MDVAPLLTDREMAAARLQKALASGSSNDRGVGRTLSSQWGAGHAAPPLSPETPPALLPAAGVGFPVQGPARSAPGLGEQLQPPLQRRGRGA